MCAHACVCGVCVCVFVGMLSGTLCIEMRFNFHNENSHRLYCWTIASLLQGALAELSALSCAYSSDNLFTCTFTLAAWEPLYLSLRCEISLLLVTTHKVLYLTETMILLQAVARLRFFCEWGWWRGLQSQRVESIWEKAASYLGCACKKQTNRAIKRWKCLFAEHSIGRSFPWKTLRK